MRNAPMMMKNQSPATLPWLQEVTHAYELLKRSLEQQKKALIENNMQELTLINDKLQVQQQKAFQLTQDLPPINEWPEKEFEADFRHLRSLMRETKRLTMGNSQLVEMAHRLVNQRVSFWMQILNKEGAHYNASGETQAQPDDIPFSTVIKRV